jgi:PAT family beta-lactamase induction signal transducer AmpG
MMLPGMISGYIQEWLGYENFFIWVMICTSVTFIVSTLIKIDPSFGKK